MKKKIVSYLIIVIVIILAYFYAHIDKNMYIYNRSSDTSTFYGTGVLKDGEEISQTFIASEETMDGVNLKVSVLGNVENVILKYELLDMNGQSVATGSIKGTELKNSKFNKLTFAKVAEAKGKQYTLVLSEENSDEQNGVGFYIEPSAEETHNLCVKGNETVGTIVARIFSHQFDVETFFVALGMIAFITVFMKVLYKYFK